MEPRRLLAFLECPHQECRKLSETLKRQLMAILAKYTLHPSVLTTFWIGLLAIRNDTPYPEVHAELPQPLCSVY